MKITHDFRMPVSLSVLQPYLRKFSVNSKCRQPSTSGATLAILWLIFHTNIFYFIFYFNNNTLPVITIYIVNISIRGVHACIDDLLILLLKFNSYPITVFLFKGFATDVSSVLSGSHNA